MASDFVAIIGADQKARCVWVGLGMYKTSLRDPGIWSTSASFPKLCSHNANCQEALADTLRQFTLALMTTFVFMAGSSCRAELEVVL